MASSNTPQAFPFPNELVDNSTKSDVTKYGLPLAQAIFYNNRHYGPMLFRNNRRLYNTWKNYALGRQAEDQYMPLLGVNARDSKKTWLKAIRWKIKNYATKRVNIAISKMTARQYDVFADPVDPLSANRKEEIKAKIKFYKENQAFFADIKNKYGVDMSPVSEDKIPETDEELDMIADMEVKDKVSLSIEKSIQGHIEYNEFEKIREQLDFDIFVLGVGIVWVRIGPDYRLIVQRVDPSKFIAPANDTPNFNDMKYWGYVDEYSIAEVKKLDRDGDLSDVAIKEIYERYRIDNQGKYYGTDELIDYKDVGKVQIMYFEQLTIDTRTYVKKTDEGGNSRLFEKPNTYYSGKKGKQEFDEKYKGERELIQKDCEMIYGGYWVVGSKHIFGYGPVKNQAHHKVDGKFGRKYLSCVPYAPHMYDGEIMSTGEQMIPVLDDLQAYNLKIQGAVATAIPKGAYIDLHALRKAKLKWDGKDMSDQEKILMYMQNGIIVGDSSDKFKPGANFKPIIELENGIANDVTTYIELIQQALFELDEIIGINKVAAASNLPERTGKAVAQMQVQGTETALDYLYRADNYLFQEMCRRIYPLHLQILKYGPKERYYDSLSKHDVDVLLKEVVYGKRDFAIQIEARPSDQEWADFFMDVESAYKAGTIKLSDKVAIKQVNKNLRQAREYLKAVERKNEKEAHKRKLQEIELNNKGNKDAVTEQRNLEMERHQNKLAEIEAEGIQERETLQLEHSLTMQQKGMELQHNKEMQEDKTDLELAKTMSQEGINAQQPQ